jgi:hypothetical protein
MQARWYGMLQIVVGPMYGRISTRALTERQLIGVRAIVGPSVRKVRIGDVNLTSATLVKHDSVFSAISSWRGERMRYDTEDILTYDDLASRWSFNRDTVRRLVRQGIVPGGRPKRWFTTWDVILHVVEGRQSPLLGKARVDAKRRPLTISDVAKALKRSQYTVREQLKAGTLSGWKIRVPDHFRAQVGNRTANRWFVDAATLSDHLARELGSSLRRRFDVGASDSHMNAQG